ncbi:MAG: DUF1800 domain-containing protein [Fimbriimonas sp.]
MSLSRRDALNLGLVGGATALLAGCGPISRRVAAYENQSTPTAPKQDVSHEVRLLNRAAFGPSAADLAAVKEQGAAAWVDAQLRADAEEDFSLQMQIRRLDVFQMGGMELRDIPENKVLEQLQQAAILRACYSKNQLHERMTDFWTNHFNIYGRKGFAAYRKANDETKVIRKHALGSFPEMLRASARSPAMLAYLDNRFSRDGVPNENYARELMELHTLGVNGGYTHHDIDEVARCFTGWTLETGLWGRGNFKFDPDRHDKGQKLVLGKVIPAGGGIEDGDRVIKILCEHPQTAHFISRKLCRYMLGTDHDGWVDRTAKTFLATKGDIAAMIRPMLLSDDLASHPVVLKRPFDMMISGLRATGAQTDGGTPLMAHLEEMGQPLYQWPMPDGYPDKNSAWTGNMLPRWNFAFALAEGRIGGTELPLKGTDPLELASAVLCRPVAALGAELTRALRGQTTSMAIALSLASPDFQWR